MKKEKYLTFLIIVVLAIIAITILVILSKKIETGKMPVSIDGKTAEGQLLLNGVGIFAEKYTGFMSRAEITDRFTSMITKEWPEMCSELKGKNSNEIEAYYEENHTDIKEKYGCTNANEFANMINDIQNRNMDLKKYDKLSIDRESYKDDSDKNNYAYAGCEVSYTDGKVIQFNSYISKRKSIKPYFIIKVKK